jgi:hypothetical protein
MNVLRYVVFSFSLLCVHSYAASDPYAEDVIYGDNRFQFSIHQSATTANGASTNAITFRYMVTGKEPSLQGFHHWDPPNGNPVVNYTLITTHIVNLEVTVAPGCAISGRYRHQYLKSRPDKTNQGTDYEFLSPGGADGGILPMLPDQDTGWLASNGWPDFNYVQDLADPPIQSGTQDAALIAFYKTAGGTNDFCGWYNLLNDPCWFRTMNGGMGPLPALLMAYANPTWTQSQIKNYDPNGSGLPWWRNQVVYLNTHWSNVPSSPGSPRDNVSLWLGKKPFTDASFWGPYHQTSPLFLNDGNTLLVENGNVSVDTGVHCPDGTPATAGELGSSGGLGGVVTGGSAGSGSGGTTTGSGGTTTTVTGGSGSGAGSGNGGVPTGDQAGTGSSTSSTTGYSPGAGTQPGNAGSTFAALVGSWASLAPNAQTAATVSFPIPIPGIGIQNFTFSSIPDSSTPYGTALNTLRLVLRSFLMILLLYKFFRRIYGDLVKGGA